MMKCMAVGVLLLALGVAVFGQQAPVLNSVTAGADGKYEAAPDTALLQFNIAAQETTSQAAYERASRAAEQIRELMRKNSIDPASAQIGRYSISPVFDYKSPKRKLIGYAVNTGVTLKLKDFSKIAAIEQQLTDLDITANQSIGYTLDNMEAAKAKAVEDAYRKARATAQVVASASGRSLGELIHASVDSFEPGIRPLTMQARAYSAAAENVVPPTEQFTPQTVTVTAHVNAIFALK
ncbi:MAG TPA: SIMPL domain-containing protein [Terriglobales bacterium]|nr:SIMPL domain-containing protein [Terriglobales bacterium]